VKPPSFGASTAAPPAISIASAARESFCAATYSGVAPDARGWLTSQPLRISTSSAAAALLRAATKVAVAPELSAMLMLARALSSSDTDGASSCVAARSSSGVVSDER